MLLCEIYIQKGMGVIVLGRKYKFSTRELKFLRKKFGSVCIIKVTGRSSDEVLKDLKTAISKTRKFNILVLNTYANIDPSIIKYLIKLRFEKEYSHYKIINVEQLMEKHLQKCFIPDDYSDLNFLTNIKPLNFWQYGFKRLIDYSGALSLLALTFPVMLYARGRIKKESSGTSMFKQLRVGKDNKEFKCIKFRSMRLDAEKDGAKFASANDDRVFAFGHIMRKTRIDELPQILNVLRGDMHLIGPRPERKVWIDKFEEIIPYYNERHMVRPGITGWAQVMYPYGKNAEDAKQKLMYDLYYIKHWTPWLEIKIIFKTILVVLGKKGQ